MIRRAVVIGALALLAGCGVSVEDVCEDLGDACEGVRRSECQQDGEQLEEASAELGCSDAFDVYLDCVDVASCGYASACEAERSELEACVDFLPPD